MLRELLFLGCHSQLTSYPYTFASYSYGCKILQPYVAATVRMHSDAVLSSTGALLMKTAFVTLWPLALWPWRYGSGPVAPYSCLINFGN